MSRQFSYQPDFRPPLPEISAPKEFLEKRDEQARHLHEPAAAPEEQEDGVIVDWHLGEGAVSDVSMLVPSVDRIRGRVGSSLERVCADRGFHSAANERALADRGIESRLCPRKIEDHPEPYREARRPRWAVSLRTLPQKSRG